jgi:dTDP-4-amino-4,6-dideoxygalactose transaminase
LDGVGEAYVFPGGSAGGHPAEADAGLLAQIIEHSSQVLERGPVRRKPWLSYERGDVLIDESDAAAAYEAVMAKRLFRYDDRDYVNTYCGRFELALAKYFSVKHALAVSSGTAAITVALLALGLEDDAPVGVTSFSFTATPSAVLQAGLRPVLLEVDETLGLDLDDLARKLPTLKALVVVHMRGFADRIETICAMAAAAGVPVIEDAVPALGLAVAGRHLGTFGAMGAFSMQSDKSLNTGEGGFVLTNSDPLHARAVALSGAYEGRCRRHLREDAAQGSSDGWDDRDLPLYSFRLDEVRAAIALNQLTKLDGRITCLRRNFDEMRQRLRDLPHIVLRRSVYEAGCLGDYLLFRVHGADHATTLAFVDALNAEGISARCLGDDRKPNVRRFWDWRYLFPGCNLAEIKAALPKATAEIGRMIDVPMSPLLEPADLDDLTQALRVVSRRLRLG